MGEMEWVKMCNSALPAHDTFVPEHKNGNLFNHTMNGKFVYPQPLNVIALCQYHGEDSSSTPSTSETQRTIILDFIIFFI